MSAPLYVGMDRLYGIFGYQVGQISCGLQMSPYKYNLWWQSSRDYARSRTRPYFSHANMYQYFNFEDSQLIPMKLVWYPQILYSIQLALVKLLLIGKSVLSKLLFVYSLNAEA